MDMETVFGSLEYGLDVGTIKDTQLYMDILKHLPELVLEERPVITVYGKTLRQPRNIGFYSDDSKGYSYSRQIMLSQPMTPVLQEALDWANHNFPKSNPFNGVLVNMYVNGSDKVGAHSDTGQMQSVVAISFGAERKFRIRKKTLGSSANPIVHDLTMKDGGVVHMRGQRFQEEFTHEIPEQKRISTPRISLTFRYHDK
jgi:alkylated DNA repair dioxygenase AlkB